MGDLASEPLESMMAANPELKEQLEQALKDNKRLLLMKGTPEAPRCGFSMRTVGILEELNVEYGAIDVLPVLAGLREVTAEMSDWATFPQLYCDGQLIGGCDIVEEMQSSGELAGVLGVAERHSETTTTATVGVPTPAADLPPYQSPPVTLG